jgi:signal transduction histidine kinase
LDAKLLGLDLGAGGAAYVADGAGRLVAQASSEGGFEASFKIPPERLAPSWREGEYQGLGGAAVLGVKAPIPGTDWSLTLERPAASAYRLVAQVRRKLSLSLLLAAALSVALCLVFTPSLVRPLREFEAAVQGMGSDDFASAITARSSDEIGSVAQALRGAQKALEKKVRQATVGLMAHRIGHDLRQPLTAVRNSLEVIRRHVSGADAVAQKHFDLVEDELRRGREYVEEILTLGRARPPALRPVDLNALVREVAAKAPVREGLALRLDLAPELPACLLDKDQVHRALANLLSNAQEAIQKAGAVEISTRAAGGRVRVVVSDDGVGIPEENRERIFEEFFTTKPAGTGLGMGIVKKIAEMHGGTLSLTSRPGGGTAAELSFPAR